MAVEVVKDSWGAYGAELCDVCGRRNSWGCGHSGKQRWYARRHQATAKHQRGKCECRTQGVHIPFDQHGNPL